MNKENETIYEEQLIINYPESETANASEIIDAIMQILIDNGLEVERIIL